MCGAVLCCVHSLFVVLNMQTTFLWAFCDDQHRKTFPNTHTHTPKSIGHWQHVHRIFQLKRINNGKIVSTQRARTFMVNGYRYRYIYRSYPQHARDLNEIRINLLYYMTWSKLCNGSSNIWYHKDDIFQFNIRFDVHHLRFSMRHFPM